MAEYQIMGQGQPGTVKLADRRTSPLLSNNPFRNRVPSGPPSPALPVQNPKPVSTNPFLDSSEITSSPPIKPATMAAPNGRRSPAKAEVSENTRELLESLSFDDKAPRRAPTQSNGTSQRPENLPSRGHGRLPPPGHRPSQSEEESRRRVNAPPRAGLGQLDIFADPPDATKPRERRPRRNSESSVRDKNSRLLNPEDEKRRQERRHRESRRTHKSKTPSHRLDIIDKLDVTSIYGTGLFHHDGPFDACNPARNRKGARAAPMQAFPKDSRNMSIGGSGPNNSRLNLDQIHGTGHEAHIDYNKGAQQQAEKYSFEMRRPTADRNGSFNPTDRVEPVHGEETIGLGTSTFLEGAPASRAAIQRRATEDEFTTMANAGGLSRKKSLAQKIRGVRPTGRMTSPEPNGITSPTSPLATGKSENNANPFFKDYDQEYDKKTAQIATAEPLPNRRRAPSSPKRGLTLERKTTAESTDGGEDGKAGNGFLRRVRSMKGPRRIRGERRDTSG